MTAPSAAGAGGGWVGLPEGYRILNDGPGREVLFREEWEHGEVYATVAEAVVRARYLETEPHA